MCGIIGMIGKPFEHTESFKRLKKLEYRGYDSFGFSDGQEIIKDIGDIQIPVAPKTVTKAILHTRWATHGGVTGPNAHPHNVGNITLVHNGILENYEELKEQLPEYNYKSETDSEVIAHFFNERLKEVNIQQAIEDFLKIAKGTFAILMLVENDNNIYAIRRDSPLVLGIAEDQFILASDIYAFSDVTDKSIFFDNDEYAIITTEDYKFFKNGQEQQKEIKTFIWTQEESTKEEYDHYMIKEIMEEPHVANRLLLSLETDQQDELNRLVSLCKNANKIIFTACGTSYHAALLGVYYLHQCGVQAQALIASEFENFVTLDQNSLVIAISQSGETMDVIESLKYAESKGATIASIVNVPYSTIQRMSKVSLNIVAGQEVCVASTKAFVNQAIMVAALAQKFGYKINLTNVAEKIELLLEQKDHIKESAESIANAKDMYILGRGLGYPVAREVALKIKEITYIHAEGMMAGELKHGTLALIEEGIPVIALIPNNDPSMHSSAKEVEARGANVLQITNEEVGTFKINTSNDGKFAILACVVGQLVAYYIAKKKGLPIDKPRNLAKSVTVK